MINISLIYSMTQNKQYIQYKVNYQLITIQLTVNTYVNY